MYAGQDPVSQECILRFINNLKLLMLALAGKLELPFLCVQHQKRLTRDDDHELTVTVILDP